MLGQPLNCILQPHPEIMAEHQVVVGSHKEVSLERRRREEDGRICQFILTIDITTVKWES